MSFRVLAGCAFALWYGQRADHQAPTRAVSVTWQALSGLAVAAAVVVMVAISETTYSMTPQVAAVTACTLVILAQIELAPGGPVQALLESAPAVWVGRRSYAFYLYHYVILTAWTTNDRGLALDGVKAAKLAVTTTAVALSWSLLEQPIQRRLKPRWQRSKLPAPDSAAVATAGVRLSAP